VLGSIGSATAAPWTALIVCGDVLSQRTPESQMAPEVSDGRRPLSLSIAGGHARVWTVELHRSPANVREALSMLPAAEQERCQAVTDRLRRERLILARAALRQILAAELGLEPSLVEIARTATGKPLLVSAAGLSFSFSHTGGWAAIVLSDTVSVGIDIEPIDRPISEGLIDRLLSAEELANVLAFPSEHRSAAFLANWTAKEACAKALDGGLPANLRRLRLRDAHSAPRLADTELQGLEVRPLHLHRDLIGALAATNDPAIHPSR
jgi:4'-phosphopantetheinyl transferase